MHVVVFVVIFIVQNSGCSIDRLVAEMQLVATVYEMEVAEDEDFIRSVYYVTQGEQLKCVRVSGDKSLFHERLLAGLHRHIPPAVLSDSHNIHKCSITLLAAEDAQGLRNTVTTQPFWSTVRYYCLVNNATLESLRDTFKDHTKIFKDAEVAIFVVNHYKKGLKAAPPNHKLEVMHVPAEGYWRVQWLCMEDILHSKTRSWKKMNLVMSVCLISRRVELTRVARTTDQNSGLLETLVLVQDVKSSKPEIRFTMGNCDIHGTVNGNVSGLDPYTPGNFGGTDWRIFSKIAEIMNWNMKYVHTTSEQYLGDYNGTWKGGMLGSLVDNAADVALCGIWIDWRKLSDGIQMSVPMKKVCMQYLVPRPVVSRNNRPVANCFTPAVHVLIFFTLAATCFMLNFMNLADKYFVPSRDVGYRSWKHCFMVVWGMLFQGNYPPQSADMGSVRRIILLWAILSMLLSCSFSSQLVSNFSHPKYTVKPKDVQDLVKFGYRQPYYGDEVFPWSGIFNCDELYTREWLSRADAIPDFDDFVETLRTKPKQALIGSMYDKSIFTPGSKLPRPIPADVLAKYETMDKCFRNIYEAFAVRQGSRFYQKINKYLTYFKQYGMLKKFYSDAVEELAKKQPGLRNLTARAPRGLRPLAVHQLSGVFHGHQIGLAISFLVFVSEILVYRRQNPKKMIRTDAALQRAVER